MFKKTSSGYTQSKHKASTKDDNKGATDGNRDEPGLQTKAKARKRKTIKQPLKNGSMTEGATPTSEIPSSILAPPANNEPEQQPLMDYQAPQQLYCASTELNAHPQDLEVLKKDYKRILCYLLGMDDVWAEDEEFISFEGLRHYARCYNLATWDQTFGNVLGGKIGDTITNHRLLLTYPVSNFGHMTEVPRHENLELFKMRQFALQRGDILGYNEPTWCLAQFFLFAQHEDLATEDKKRGFHAQGPLELQALGMIENPFGIIY